MGAVFTPNIVTVLPVLNEEKYIAACLHSLIEQSYPSDLHSIIVLDGGSNDRTQDLVREAAKRSEKTGGPSIELHHNPGKFVAQGRNLAMSMLPDEATHVLELIGHSTVAPKHLETLATEWERIAAIEAKPLAALGSRVLPREGDLGRIETWVEATLSSPLGSGGGQFDAFERASPCRIPAFVLHSRKAIEDVNGWDESFISSQDSDLSMRLAGKGYALWRTPNASVHMTKRTDLSRWWRMGHRYGFWRTKTVLKHPKRLSFREYLPWFGLITTFALAFITPVYACVPIVAYAGVLLLEGVRMMLRFGRPSLMLGVPICMVLLHTSFSIGLLDGFLRKGRAASDR